MVLSPVFASVPVRVLAANRWPNQRSHWILWVMEMWRETRNGKAAALAREESSPHLQAQRHEKGSCYPTPGESSSQWKGVTGQKLWLWLERCSHHWMTACLWAGEGRATGSGYKHPHFNCLSLPIPILWEPLPPSESKENPWTQESRW